MKATEAEIILLRAQQLEAEREEREKRERLAHEQEERQAAAIRCAERDDDEDTSDDGTCDSCDSYSASPTGPRGHAEGCRYRLSAEEREKITTSLRWEARQEVAAEMNELKRQLAEAIVANRVPGFGSGFAARPSTFLRHNITRDTWMRVTLNADGSENVEALPSRPAPDLAAVRAWNTAQVPDENGMMMQISEQEAAPEQRRALDEANERFHATGTITVAMIALPPDIVDPYDPERDQEAPGWDVPINTAINAPTSATLEVQTPERWAEQVREAAAEEAQSDGMLGHPAPIPSPAAIAWAAAHEDDGRDRLGYFTLAQWRQIEALGFEPGDANPITWLIEAIAKHRAAHLRIQTNAIRADSRLELALACLLIDDPDKSAAPLIERARQILAEGEP